MKLRTNSLRNPQIVCLLINLIVILLILLISRRLPPVIPLFYGQAQGEEQLASRAFLILPPAVASIFILINSALVKTVKDQFLKNVLVALAIGCTTLSTITVIKIIFLVGNL